MAACYRKLGDEEKEKEALVKSFIYDLPRPEVSCRMGDIYTNKWDFKKAITWYHLALDIEEENHAGFKQIAYATWYPHLQLCYCFWKIGDSEQSFQHQNLDTINRMIPISKRMKNFLETILKITMSND